mgnify:CR=1 FL=1
MACGLPEAAAGRNARAQHHGSFVWSSYDNPAPSFAENMFFVNAPNGLGINSGLQRPDGGGQYWMDLGNTGGGRLINTSVGAGLTLGGVWQNASDQNRKTGFAEVNASHAAFADAEAQARERLNRLLAIKGSRTAASFQRELGFIMWEYCGMARTDEGLQKARGLIRDLRARFWEDLKVPGSGQDLNQSLEKAGRVADFLEFAELMTMDALARRESCGGHFNEAFQTEDNEAKRDDENMCHVAVWEYAGEDKEPIFHKEPLVFENVQLVERSYK